MNVDWQQLMRLWRAEEVGNTGMSSVSEVYYIQVQIRTSPQPKIRVVSLKPRVDDLLS